MGITLSVVSYFVKYLPFALPQVLNKIHVKDSLKAFGTAQSGDKAASSRSTVAHFL